MIIIHPEAELIVKVDLNIEPPTTTKQRMRISFKRSYQPKVVTDAIAMIRDNLMPHRPEQPLVGPLKVIIRYGYQYPKSWPKKKTTQDWIYRTNKPDWDNASKLFCDSLNGAFWEDDKQIAIGIHEKYYSKESFIQFELYKLKEL